MDQLPTWALARYLPHLDVNGAIRRGIESGAYAERVAYAHASTYTAPGHAAIYSGATPAVSGIVANEIYDRELGKAVSVLSDVNYPVLGLPSASASPGRLRAKTVSDLLKSATHGQARVVSLSIKDRGAVLPGGQHPDMALWYEPSLGAFTTSGYYAREVPAFVTTWQRAQDSAGRMGEWTPTNANLFARLLGPDDGEGEGDWLGLHTTFPHLPAAGPSSASAFRIMPQGTQALLSLASECVDRFQLGQDDVPDLLLISVSATDYAGHVFGAESWEYLDQLVRADRELGGFLDRLAKRTDLAVLLTSDHGVAPLPERSRARGEKAGRILPRALAQELDDTVRRVLGPGRWVDAYVEPFVYLSEPARVPSTRDRVVRTVLDHLKNLQSVAAAYDVRTLGDLDRSSDPIDRAVAASAASDAPGDIYVVPAKNYVVDPAMAVGRGTSHGSPWEYDREVPLVAWGVGVVPARIGHVVDFRTTAATLAGLLRIPPPETARVPPLPGVSAP